MTVVAGLALAGCGGGGSPTDLDSGDRSVTGPASTEGSASAGLSSPATDAYDCMGAGPTPAELDDLASLPSPDEAAFELASTNGPLGDRADWGKLATGWLIDRRPLEGEGGTIGLVAASPDGSVLGPCIPWSPGTGAIWTPGGGPGTPGPAAAGLEQARCEAVGRAGGISVFWWDLPPGARWELRVDGQVLGSDQIPTGAPPVGALTAAFAQRLAEYGRPPADDGETAPQGVRDDFAAMGAPLGIDRSYEMHLSLDGPAGATERLVACGTAAVPAELPVPTCTLTLMGGVPRITLSDVGLAYAPDTLTVIRDGEPLPLAGQLDGTRTDLGAPPGPHRYQVEVRDPLTGRAPVTADCGSVTVTDPPTGADALRAGEEVFDTVMLGPYLYARAEQGGVPVDLVMQYTGPGFDFHPAHPGPESLNPYTIHAQLIAAVEAGTPVTFELDPATGLPRTWTVGGVAYAYRCVNVDTASPDLRPTACDDSHNRLSAAP